MQTSVWISLCLWVASRKVYQSFIFSSSYHFTVTGSGRDSTHLHRKKCRKLSEPTNYKTGLIYTFGVWLHCEMLSEDSSICVCKYNITLLFVMTCKKKLHFLNYLPHFQLFHVT